MPTRLVIHGRVQGVFFRDWTVAEARAFNLSGWVRNLPDGTVETVANGDPAAVEEFVHRCRTGPERAHVDRIDRSEVADDDLPHPFTRR